MPLTRRLSAAAAAAGASETGSNDETSTTAVIRHRRYADRKRRRVAGHTEMKGKGDAPSDADCDSEVESESSQNNSASSSSSSSSDDCDSSSDSDCDSHASSIAEGGLGKGVPIKRKRKGSRADGGKKERHEKKSLVDVSTLPLDVTGVSFMMMGDVNRSVCEGLIYQHGGTVSSRVLKRKAQYVIAGATKRTSWTGMSSGPGTQLWKEAEEYGKTFITQRDFERWMRRAQAAKDKQESETHAADEHVAQLLLEATPLSQVLIDLVVAYTVEEAPILPAVRAWLKLEQRASDDTHASALPAPATDEQIADVEARLKTRLPFALRQLLRLHNGAPLQGDSAGMCAWPSTDDLITQRPESELFTLPLRWLLWHRSFDSERTPHHVQSIYFVAPHGPFVATTQAAWARQVQLYALGESMEQFVEQYVQAWRSNVDAADSEREVRKDTERRAKEAAAPDSAAGVTAAAIVLASADTPQLSLVAACRPSALSVPCMQRTWPTLREACPRLWKQTQAAQVRGQTRHRGWMAQLEPRR